MTENGYHSAQSSLLASNDISTEKETSEKKGISQELAVWNNSLGILLQNASCLLDDLEANETLGPAIRQYALDLAGIIGKVANNLGDSSNDDDKHKTGNDREESAKTCPAENHTKTPLEQSDQSVNFVVSGDNDQPLEKIEMTRVMNAAKTILLDVQDALQSIGNEESEELADVSSIVARLLVWNLIDLQNAVGDKIGINCSGSDGRNDNGGRTMEIEVIEETRHDEVDANGGNNYHEQNDSNDELNPDSSYSTNVIIANDKKPKEPGKRNNNGRLRVLWPPILPTVTSTASKYASHAASQNPIVCTALALTLWPAALLAAICTTPLILTDVVLQNVYNTVQDTPAVESIEKGANNLCQVGKLHYLVGKLVVKKSVRVGLRQLERRGGLKGAVEDVAKWGVESVKNPVESLEMSWRSLVWGFKRAEEGIGFVTKMAYGVGGHGAGGGSVPIGLH